MKTVKSPKDTSQPHYTQINDLVLLVAENKYNNKLFNVMDIDGNTPKEFSVNWRTASHVREEIFQHLEKQGTLKN